MIWPSLILSGGVMDLSKEFGRYMAHLAEGLGHADRHAGLSGYCTGLMLPLSRKCVEPMAARVDPLHASARHQALHHFVAKSEWSDTSVMTGVRDWVMPSLDLDSGCYWIIDDTGFPKKGKHSVGVARQYCGQLGKQDNCQVAASLSVANHHASLPVAYRLYMPKDWAKDRSRRRKAGVPKEISFKTKSEIALEQLRWACEAGLPRGVVLMDAGYGADTDMRANITMLGLSYVAGIMPNTTVWAPGTGPLPPKKWSGQGRPPKLIRRDARHGPNSVKALALALPANTWRTIKWREGSADWLSSRFARLRVRVAHRDYNLTESRPEEWLLIEWPEEEKEPTKYWLSTLPEGIVFHRLVDIAKLRWRIERDYQELKQEVGLGHFEGRGWRGFHHHATLCIAAYGFLISERETIPPSGPRSTTPFPELTVPKGYRPRGSAATARASHPKLDRNHASTI